jgi:beta-glucosidase-like glycosyl hydrolase
VVTGLLKDELGFKGLVFTDALDMKGVSAIPQVTTKALLAGNDMVLVQFNTKNAVQELVDAVESGQLSKDELDAKCRKVLMYKYMLGLRNRQPQLRVSGMSYRINTEEAQVLAAKLRRSAVTVLNNYFDVLPLAPVEGDIAVLSIGEKEVDAPFVEGEDNSLLDVLVNDDAPIADRALMNESLAKEIDRALATLTERECEIIKMFFGIGSQEMTLEEIGDKFGLTRERVRQIKEKAIRRLRQGTRSKLLKSYLG